MKNVSIAVVAVSILIGLYFFGNHDTLHERSDKFLQQYITYTLPDSLIMVNFQKI